MRVLLIGEWYSENLGDPLLCQTVEKVLSNFYPSFEYITFDLSGRNKKLQEESLLYRKCKNVLRLSKWYCKYENKKRIKKQIKKSIKEDRIDVAIFVGGELFMEYFADKICTVLKLLSDTHVLFHACGMEHLSEKAKKNLGECLQSENVISISLRDSYNDFINIFPFLKEKVIDTYDTALLCSEYFEYSNKKTFEYGIGLIADDSLFEFQVKLIQQIIQSRINWQAFTNGAPLDYSFARRVLLHAGVEESDLPSKLHQRPKSATELVKQITEYSKIISFRLHSQIIAASYGIPCYGFVWDQKVSQFYKKLKLNNHFCNPFESDFCLDSTLSSLCMDKYSLKTQALFCGIESKKILIKNLELSIHKDLTNKCNDLN